ncbi:uncharacterized protein PRCAT00003858001 [Priceomyces carsonii]|uniref:uncharacterized protein n=1 Tax=Priceomyces carsonii TaxID=28549 RepID=UPI002EDA5A5C|nr:unnamed protein product [Priceomyces carsonii]
MTFNQNMILTQDLSLQIDDVQILSQERSTKRWFKSWNFLDMMMQVGDRSSRATYFEDSSNSSILEVLDSDSSGSTFELLRIHIYRLILVGWTSLLIFCLIAKEKIKDLFEFRYIFWCVLISEAKMKSKMLKTSTSIITVIYNKCNYLYYILTSLRPVLLQTIFQKISESLPSGLSEFKKCIPIDLTPRSIGVIFTMKSYPLLMCPKVPQPFLDADRIIKVPSEEEVQKAIFLRNEYFTHQSTFIAAEKVRLISEISRFITWNCFISTVSQLNIYEKEGIVWEDLEDCDAAIRSQLVLLGQSILSELHSFKKRCKESELEEFEALLPSITLVEVVSGATLSLNNITSCSKNDTDSIDYSLSSSCVDRRKLTVYLSDNRLREELILEGLKSTDSNELERTLYEKLPPFPQLLLIPSPDDINIQTQGFISNSTHKEEDSALVYLKTRRLGFNFFSSSLFYYRCNNEDLIFNISFENSMHTSTQSLFSYASLISGHYLAAFFHRLRQLRFFDLHSSKQDAENSSTENFSRPRGSQTEWHHSNDLL